MRYSVRATLAVGSIVDFVIDADGAGNLATGGINAVNDGCDTTVLTGSIAVAGSGPPPGNKFIRGDTNSDGSVNITDGIYVLNFLFLGGPSPTCLDAADTNNDSGVNITDGIYVLNFLFLGGPAPPAPHPACGADPEGDDDTVTCATAGC